MKLDEDDAQAIIKLACMVQLLEEFNDDLSNSVWYRKEIKFQTNRLKEMLKKRFTLVNQGLLKTDDEAVLAIWQALQGVCDYASSLSIVELSKFSDELSKKHKELDVEAHGSVSE
tara:strand:+ start:138 stop:482 length:345 start_codon:yes stop_codon:yes gene_type:complete